MTICRMTFDIAVVDSAPDIYDSRKMIEDAIKKCPIVIGVETLKDYCERTHILSASEIITENINQIKRGGKAK